MFNDWGKIILECISWNCLDSGFMHLIYLIRVKQRYFYGTVCHPLWEKELFYLLREARHLATLRELTNSVSQSMDLSSEWYVSSRGWACSEHWLSTRHSAKISLLLTYRGKTQPILTLAAFIVLGISFIPFPLDHWLLLLTYLRVWYEIIVDLAWNLMRQDNSSRY
jgi:hypothetical protein